ncbi:MAG: translation initiation factor IF-2, partial [Candidatus Aquicultorales bacterium]
PRQAEPAKAAPRQAEPAKAAPRQAEPVKAAPKKAEPVKAAPRQAQAPAPQAAAKVAEKAPASGPSRSEAKRAALDFKPEFQTHSKSRSKGGRRGKSRRRGQYAKGGYQEPAVVEQELSKEVDVTEATTVGEFAESVHKPTTDIIRMLMKLGELKTINQPMSMDAMTIIAEELGYALHVVSPEEYGEEEAEEETILEARPPVVTVMGHVDHGKTSILDAIRQTEVAAGEAGGITQHIGAYQVVHGEKPITFIDTPGHEAFTAMRARGANVTDIVVLVVAADDGVMPQTVEAINHAKAANVPIVVAINKIDKDNANPDRVKKELADYELVPEEWGGETVMVQVSAKKKLHINELLEMILLVADIKELKATSRGHARGVCIESKLDHGRGPVATVLIHKGTLKLGEAFVAGLAHGRVRMMNDYKGNVLETATPAQPVEVVGFSSVPHAGDEFRVVVDDKTARQMAEERALKRRLIDEAKKHRHITLEDLHARIAQGEVKDLNVIIKADVQGSIEAIRDALQKIGEKEAEVRINVIHTGVGGVTETDIMLASASDAIVIGFNVRPDAKAKTMADQEKVDVRSYRVIYQVVEDITDALTGMLAPELEEVEQGRVEIRDTFKSSRAGIIAGCFVTDGEVERNSRVRLVRDGTVIYEGQISSLKRFKEDTRLVKAGYECGITLEDFQDVKVGDIIEAYRIVERQRQLGE